MENEGNSLLELPLESSEMLEEVNLGTHDVDTSVDNVGAMLIDESAGGNISCMESNSIDFGFVHSDLGNSSDFNIDNPRLFGITDHEIDAREDCDDIFRDTACFNESNTYMSKQIDAGTSLQTGLVTVPGFGKTNLYRDLGLKLQVIPLNNLQYVSTIQTSRGLHILAIPTETSVSPDYNEVNVEEIDEKAKQCMELDFTQSLGNLMVNGLQTELDDLPNLQEDTVKKTELAEKTIDSQQTNKLPSGSEKETLKKSPSSKSTKKARNTCDRKFKISRKKSYCKNYVKRILSERSFIKERKKRTFYIDVVKPPSLRKRKMVSLLKASVTNKLNQVPNTACRNTDITNKKEIKLTFHLKPNIIGNNNADDDHTKASVTLDDKTELISNTDCFIQNMTCGNNSHNIDTYVTSEAEKFQNSFAESKVDSQEASENPQVIEDTIKLPEIPDKIQEIDTLPSLPKEGGKKYQCKICLSTFCRKGHFNNHLKTHSEFTSAVKVTVDKVIENNGEEQNLRQYQQKMLTIKEKDNLEKDVTLPSFVDSQKYSGIESKHLKCEFCEMEFKTKGNLTRHKLTHNLDMENKVQGRYRCGDCNKYFLQKCDLKRHVATHSGTYPYVCCVCKKGFIRRSDLTVHEKFHTQEKRYRCQMCSKAYFQTGDLSRHMRRNHSDLCEFSCQECGKKYTTMKTLNLHIKMKH